MNQQLNWGILGTGNIARTFAKGLAGSKTGKLMAVGSRSGGKSTKFGDEFNVPHRHGSYDALLADSNVQAIYISTPHPFHAEWAVKAAEAGKHILCEKPLGINHAEAMAVVEAAQLNDVFLMEAFMYRCHPQTARLVELLREKVVGEVRLIQANFSFQTGFNPEGRLLNNNLAGGGILDVGCYCVSMARLIAGVATGKDFAEPIEVKGCAQIGPVSRVDEWAVASLKFSGASGDDSPANAILAQLSTGVLLQLENVVRIFGSEGSILLPNPWTAGKEGTGSTKIIINRKKEEPREIIVEITEGIYSLEADIVAQNIEKRQAPFPATGWDDSLGNMKALDQWRAAIGLIYDNEKLTATIPTITRRPLEVRSKHNMKYGRIEGVNKPVSRLLMGVDNQRALPHAAVMFDDFFQRGGNAFDTAFGYGGGDCEKALGQWVKMRGLRERIVILGKGAHTPFCDPKSLGEQLKTSLERLQTDYLDIYMMHRDNLDIPVGEFIDVLNEHKQAGRLKIFGASNWSLQRIDVANRYAQRKGLAGFSAISNNFSLARMIDPVWKGCIAASDPESRKWFKRKQMPLMPWSSQARGFFTDLAGPDKTGDKELVRCWYSADNFQRKQRVNEMAEKQGVLPINIALAYVLNQPFPTFPLIGPRLLDETRTSLPALDIDLSPKELKWMNLEN